MKKRCRFFVSLFATRRQWPRPKTPQFRGANFFLPSDNPLFAQQDAAPEAVRGRDESHHSSARGLKSRGAAASQPPGAGKHADRPVLGRSRVFGNGGGGGVFVGARLRRPLEIARRRRRQTKSAQQATLLEAPARAQRERCAGPEARGRPIREALHYSNRPARRGAARCAARAQVRCACVCACVCAPLVNTRATSARETFLGGGGAVIGRSNLRAG